MRLKAFHADGQTDGRTRHDKANSRFSQFYEKRLENRSNSLKPWMILTQPSYKMKLVVKLIYEPRHMHVGGTGTAPLILNVTIRWDWEVKFTLRILFNTYNIHLDPLDRKLDGLQIRFGHCGQEKFSLCVQQIEPRFLRQPSHSLVTDEKRLITLPEVTKCNIPKSLPTTLRYLDYKQC